MDRPGETEKRRYYERHPYDQKDSRIVAPVDSTKTITRPLLTRDEAQELINQIPAIPQMELINDTVSYTHLDVYKRQGYGIKKTLAGWLYCKRIIKNPQQFPKRGYDRWV